MHYAPNRRFTLLLGFVGVLVVAFTFISFFSRPGLDSSSASQRTGSSQLHDSDHDIESLGPALSNALLTDTKTELALPGERVLTGPHIASALENATAKAELGRAAWKLFHTTFARFPDAPTPDEQAALRAYVYLFARLYPCGECAEHFAAILAEFPPQVSSRSAAAAWGCHVHNQVSGSLAKELFDCSKIGDFYHCGCSDIEDKSVKGIEGDKADKVPSDERKLVELEKEGYQRGG